MSKHILLYTDDPGTGGVAQYNDMIALGLRAQGYRVTVAQTQSENPLITSQQQAGVRHEWLDFDTVEEFGRTGSDLSQAQAIFPRTQPDLILFSDSYPLSNLAAKEVALQMGIPYVIVVGFVAPYLVQRFGEGVDAEYYLGMLERQYRRAKQVIAVCRENLELLYKLFRLPSDKGQVIHYGRPEHFFSPRDGAMRDRLRKSLGVPAKGVLCFTAARLESVKGFQYQLDAIATLRHTSVWSNLYFVWAGEGSMRPELEYALAELEVGDRVTLLGQQWDIANWLEAADLFILPSKLEGMPLTIMEAMAKGVPVIASAVSGIPEELGTTGKLLTNPAHDHEATVNELVSTIQAWAANPEARRAVGEAEQRRASQMFRQFRMVEETLTVLQRALLSPNDYVSPELALVQPDEAFPHLMVGDPQTCPWPYLRREIPHNWYVDQRLPTVGFLSRDEAHILYNSALLFAGKQALEIGCYMGWSTCHLALAGVMLDVIDPQLSDPMIYASVFSSLQSAGVAEAVTLIGDHSPEAVEAIATQHQRKWSLILIDGDAEAPGPLQNAIACDQVAEADAMILLHDLASPEVAAGLDYLKQQGWNTMVYQTMQIMGVAWRGAVEPVAHQPDPRVHWILPPHLQDYPVSGSPPNLTPPPATPYTPPPSPYAAAAPVYPAAAPNPTRIDAPDHPRSQANGDELTRSPAQPAPAQPKQQEIPSAQRPWHSGLPYETLKSIHLASHHYSHRGVPMSKDPFDLALYPLLIWNLQPRTIIEIGSNAGGSALWLADLLTTYGINGQVYSIDMVPVTNVAHPRLTFLQGNGRSLGDTLTPQFLAGLPRPWLVIDDADHAYETTHQILEFFHAYLRADEYLVVEGGIMSDYTRDLGYNSGPHRALKEFLASHLDDYIIDGSYCDFFGYNLTWNTNGYLKKLVDPPLDEASVHDPNIGLDIYAESAELADAETGAGSTRVEPDVLMASPLTKPFKIVVDGIFFQFGSQTGISRLWKSLLVEWAKNGFAQHILVLDRNGTAPKIFGVRYCLVPPFAYGAIAADRALMQQICDEEAADLFVSTYYTTPLVTPSMFMAYDMIPEMVMKQDLDHLMWQHKHDAIRAASAYLAISDSTRRDLIRLFPEVPPDGVTLAYCGLDADFQPASAQQIQQLRVDYTIQQPYFLLVGNRGGYKNTIQFFKAFAQLPNRQEYAIVAANFNTTLEPELVPYAVDTNLHLLPLNDEELKVAYSGAIVLVYPSKYEGFGLPVLEAMACGCPVIACRTSSIPEVGGEAVLYVDVDDVDGLTAALQTVQEPAVRDRLIADGLIQARKFSWQQMADTVSDALTKVVRSPRPVNPDVSLLSHLLICLRVYQQDSTNTAALSELRNARRQLAERWLAQDADALPACYRGTLGQAQQLLLESGLKDQPLTEVEQAAIAPILETIQASLAADRPLETVSLGAPPRQANAPALAPLLVAMLYCHPSQLPALLPPLLPTWLQMDYLNFLLTNSGLFWQVGELDRHANDVAAWTAHVHHNVMSQPGDQFWQTTAKFWIQHSIWVPLYFVERELKTVYQQRADILGAVLAELEQPLAYEFPMSSGDRPKLRIGILAQHFAPQTETFATLPVFQHLDRQRFEVILFTVAPIEHRLGHHCAERADAVVELSSNIPAAVLSIRSADLDLLFIATNVTATVNTVTQLAAYRLARVQLTGMNSPLSTGMPHIDYYLSSRLTNPAWDVQRHYSETLVPLSGAAQCFDFATEANLLPTAAVSRESLGIAADAVVFVSGANFFKITPELDIAWAHIIAHVPNAVLLLYHPFNPNWTNHYPAAAFRQRLTAHFAAQGLAPDRLILLDAAPNRADVIERLKLADLYLDSYPFSGMTSLLEPLEIGLPPIVVEMDVPVSIARGAAFLRDLQVPELIVDGAAAYIDLAIALGIDPARRQALGDRIRQGMGRKPSFLDSERYGAELSIVFQSLFHTYQHTHLAQTLRLQKTNLIAFPDWHQPEEILFETLIELLQTVLTSGDRQHTTLLIYTGDFDPEAVDLLLSSVTLDLLAATDLDLDDDSAPEITLLPPLMPAQWQVLLSHLTSRLALTYEDEAAIAQSGTAEIPDEK